MNKKNVIAIGALQVGLSIAAGAFGAHALKAHLDAYALSIWHTASQYHALHGLALIVLAVLPLQTTRWIAYAWLAGMVLFCGSLYALALTGLRSLGMITPLGGLAFLIGWGGLAWMAWRTPNVN